MAKRILIYTNHFYPEQFKINEIVHWLSSEKYHIRVVTGLPNYPSGEIFKNYKNIYNSNVQINRLFLVPRGSGSNFLIIINYLTYFISCLFFTVYIALFKKKYDVIFVHHTSPILIAIPPIIYSLFHNPKKILWDLDIWPESLRAVNVIKSKFIITIIRSIVKIIYSNYKIILVSSKSLIDLVAKRFNGRIIHFPNWADSIIEKNIINKNYDIKLDKNKFNIMYTGNIGEAQDFKSLIQTIELVEEKIHWTFVGDGRFKNDFKKLLIQKKLQNKITFIDQVKVEKLPSIVSKANALFLSLKSDNIFSKTVPAKLQTYMALGKPIIGVLKGEGADIIKESKCGIVESKYDYVELAKKINSFANNLEVYHNLLGNNGKSFYKKKYSSIKRKDEILKLINE